MRRVTTLLALGVAAGLMAGCDKPPSPTAPAPKVKANAVAAPPVDLAAAAEPFEGLTEVAFSATPAQLDTAIAAAGAAAMGREAQLKPADRAQVQKEIAAIAQARRLDQRADIALASVEIYRVMVSAGSRRATDKQVSLLDYAGFRFDADLKANPVRWKDASAAAAFGQAHWQIISTAISDAFLQTRMSKALTDMGKAAAKHDRPAAAAAAQRELDLVDALEVFVAKPR